ncbi:putative guanine nucleotide-binding protein alpha-1 subunit [Leucosporidium creatinivorum]|uniref:Putative guanine nucleotide-binding protein alpha-1 subunit n=1 Tax=Leucosporidium creatinivorum TaxID=106004 RepID=A0A1Y2EYL7_9BASI|nr:putative guanine nucleotide-binding protein alpha-1 subunit [Leucosporidium creatinivorum]
MGCASSKNGEDPQALARNRSIEAQLARDRQELAREVKMLILGTGESGKSTVMKQMTIMHCGGFSDEERVAYAEIIFSNTVQSMQAVLEALPLLSVVLLPSNQEAAYLVEEVDPDERSTDKELQDALVALWNDPAVRAVLEVKSRFQINDSAEYYFQALQRTFNEAYLPSDQDIIRSRVRTTGIVENSFAVGKQRYRIFDVGGQRSERKKWVHCFEGVNVLLFLVAISEYDQMLYEDETQSRMSEALTVFESITNSRWFAKSTLVLFLNKIDLFKEKLPKSSLRNAFPGYRGDDESYEDAAAFILQQFKQLYIQPRPFYSHLTEATDTAGIQVVINVVQDTILRDMLASSGILE